MINSFMAMGASLSLLLGQVSANDFSLEQTKHSNQVQMQTGQASYYSDYYHGRRTASGEIFNQNALTAAHRTLPFGTIVCVRNQRNGRTVRVRITDRGPFVRGRIIDLSRAAAAQIGMINAGVVPVTIQSCR